MQQSKTNTAASIFWWAIVIAYLGVIFYFSGRTATESATQSGSILDFIRNILGDNALSDFIVRKSAHFLEFAGLSFLLNIAFFVSTSSRELTVSTLLAMLYAVTDELHQSLVPGRSCELRDWCVDAAGTILGMFFAFIVITIISKYRKNHLDSRDKVF